MFLHYVVINDALSVYDYYIGIPISDVELFLLHMILTGVLLFVVVFLHIRQNNDKNSTKTSKTA